MYLGKSVQLNSALAIPTADGTTAYWSNSWQVGFGVSFSLQYQGTVAGGNPQVRILLEQSYKQLTAAQEGLINSNWVVPDLQPDVASLVADTNWHIIGFAPTEARWARFKLIGLTGNSSTTTMNLILLLQEPGRGAAGI